MMKSPRLVELAEVYLRCFAAH